METSPVPEPAQTLENPYQRLVIYNFEGIPALDREIERDPLFLGMWVEEETSFLFFKDRADASIHRIQARNPGMALAETYEMSCEEWHGGPIEPYFVESLCIAPPWNRPELPAEERIREILLDPGVVFGTGRHQTTEDCLDLIHRLFTRKKISSMLDIGTGTGLLSLGAAALGSPRVLACDFNLLAVKTCLANIRLNRFQDRILAFQARGEQVMDLESDLLVANIHYDIMKILIQTPGFLEKRYFILSGLLNSEAKKILADLDPMPVRIVERRCPDGIWNTILGERA
ncbi:50S ribosomal protein L11 methyltransferase [Desulfospira joergensenii]|uniref:50S ribosomal protein L11 methyltransferase n=1 Tax=Desulfospira joergensenii TaxID=53329 RepID=UPI0003B7411B|nr:50S ribosomal protein L11 methyltransferase [Desulfospira joergensenii]